MNTTVKKRSVAAEVWQRLCRNKMAMLGLGILVILALGAIFADVIADYDTMVVAQDVKNRLQGPSAAHWFGTDEFGRDIFARMLHGSRVSLVVGLISVSISLILGGTLGAFAGFYGGRVDNIIMRIMDIFLAVPSILLAMTIVAALGTDLIYVMLAIGVSGIPSYARIVRAAVMSVRIRNLWNRPELLEHPVRRLFSGKFCLTAWLRLSSRQLCLWQVQSCLPLL